jgi:hypothetical protein
MVVTIYAVLINVDKFAVQGLTYGITCIVLFFKLTFLCQTATNEASSSRILVEKLLLEGNCRNETIEELKMFSLQLQAMAK